MAITRIVGFQQYKDYLDVDFTDFSGFANIPIVCNNYSYTSPFRFTALKGRTWLRAVGRNIGNSGYEERSRKPGMSIPFTWVYPDYLDGNYDTFWIGLRAHFQNKSYRPHPFIHISNQGDDNWGGQGLVVFDKDDIPYEDDTTLFIELKVDTTNMVVERWCDNVRMTDITIPESNDFSDFTNWRWWFNDRGDYSGNYERFYINDLYFLVDSTQDNDGLPSSRLGPVEVKALMPDVAAVPATWNVPDGQDPVDLVTESIRDPAMRDVPSLSTDSSGESANFGFARPDVGEGKVIYTELEAYGYRDFGDGVQLHTKVHQGTFEDSPKTFELEPERLKVGAEAIRPGSYYNAPDGTEWTEEKLNQLELEVWTTKIE